MKHGPLSVLHFGLLGPTRRIADEFLPLSFVQQQGGGEVLESLRACQLHAVALVPLGLGNEVVDVLLVGVGQLAAAVEGQRRPSDQQIEGILGDGLGIQLDRGADQEGKEDLVPLEEPLADVLVEPLGDVLDEHEVGVVDVRFQVSLQRDLTQAPQNSDDGLVEDLLDVIEGVLVHGVDLRECGGNKEHDRTPVRDAPVEVSLLVDGSLYDSGGDQARRDLRALGLRDVQRLNQLVVVQDGVLAALGELREDPRLQGLELLLNLRDVLDQLVPLPFYFWFEVEDDIGQQLLVQPLVGHGEVDDLTLNESLRQVVGVRELGREVEPEVVVVLYGPGAEEDHLLGALQVDSLIQELVDSGIYCGIQVLDDHLVATEQGILELLVDVVGGHLELGGVVVLGHLEDLVVLRRTPRAAGSVSEPVQALELGVDEQRELIAFHSEDGILYGDLVARKALDIPASDL